VVPAFHHNAKGKGLSIYKFEGAIVTPGCGRLPDFPPIVPRSMMMASRLLSFVPKGANREPRSSQQKEIPPRPACAVRIP
jgi:hypothetical protein